MKNHLPSILALEPDVRQASILKRMIRDRVHAELIVVDSRDGAISAVNAQVPDVILLTALLSPRDEAEIIAHLRTVEGAEHVQTHTIPQLASSSEDGDAPAGHGGLLGKLRRRKVAETIPGCDPSAFADEVSVFITRAAEMKVITSSPSAPSGRAAKKAAAGAKQATAGQTASGAPDSEEPAPEVNAESAWSSPFEWRRDSPGQRSGKKAAPPKREPLVTAAPLAVVAEEEEQRRAEEQARAGGSRARRRTTPGRGSGQAGTRTRRSGVRSPPGARTPRGRDRGKARTGAAGR